MRPSFLAHRVGCAVLIACITTGCGSSGSAQAQPAPSVQPSSPPTPIVSARPALAFVGPTVPASISGKQELSVSQIDGSGATQLTSDGSIKFLPHFSPDGRRMLYTKFLVGGEGSPDGQTVVAVLDLATLKETVLTGAGNAYQPAWSPDGTRIVHSTYGNTALWIMNADGSANTLLAEPAGTPTDMFLADPLWSSDNWIYFVVEQIVDGCMKVRVDRIRPDGSARTQISDGGPNCTPVGMEQNGDADPAISPDGSTIYSSRGLPTSAPGVPGHTLRHLYAFSSAPFVAGKIETDLTATLERDCIAGVPKVSPNGAQIAVFLFCGADPAHAGVYLTNPSGSAFTFVETGFGADWNPAR